MMRSLLTRVSCLLLAAIVTTSTAATDDKLGSLEALANQIKSITWKLDRGRFEPEDLSSWTKIAIKLSGEASVCISESEAELTKLQESIDGLGEKVKDEAADVTRQRKELQKQKGELDKRLAKCNLYKQNSNKASEHIALAEKSYFREKYLIRGPHIITLVSEYLKSPFTLAKDSGTFLWKNTGFQELDKTERFTDPVIILIVIFAGLWLRKVLKRLEQSYQWKDDFSEHLLRATLTTSAQYAPWLLGAASAALLLYLDTRGISPKPFITTFAIGFFLYLSFIAIVRLIFTPAAPAQPFIAFTGGLAVKLSRRLHMLALLSLIGYMAFYTVYSESIPESNRLLLRDIYSLAIVLNLIWLVWVLFRAPKLKSYGWLFISIILVFAVTLVAEWSGYRNLGLSSRQAVLSLLVLFILFVAISRIFRDLFNAMDDGTYAWCLRLHEKLGVDKEHALPGLIWIRLITTILIWGGFFYIVISAWDTTGAIIEQARSYLVNGFEIGSFRIVPSQILISLVVFAFILIFSGWLRKNMEHNWLPKTTMDRGGREALVTITGYTMFLVAALIAMSVAGFDFSNIAIIAGALSVGIGFGLQNIVNNFVSGLILLFERPIRKGDWIVVGDTEGYVTDIRIRSTRIATFDQSDVIVPNSELISNQVTNWMLENVRGRAIIKIGVAYGSDIEKVRYILTQIAEADELVVADGTSPRPLILFRNFGDSALEFELRVHLYEVDRRLSTVSRLNFAIDKAFREEGIQIPFPQRDVHVKSLPDKDAE